MLNYKLVNIFYEVYRKYYKSNTIFYKINSIIEDFISDYYRPSVFHSYNFVQTDNSYFLGEKIATDYVKFKIKWGLSPDSISNYFDNNMNNTIKINYEEIIKIYVENFINY